MCAPASWKRVTADGVAVNGPCILYVVSGEVTVAGSCGTVYAGLDTVSGSQILHLEALANRHNQVHFGTAGIFVPNGIYVDMDANGVELLLVYREVSREPDLKA